MRNFKAYMKFIFLFIQLLYAQGNTDIQPNIVFVQADDLGWADVNWNNKESLPQYRGYHIRVYNLIIG